MAWLQGDREHGREHDSDSSSSDEEDPSVADSAFVYKSQAALKYAGSGTAPDFERMSARLEKDLGMGGDAESLLGYKPDVPQLGAGSVISDGEALQYTAAAFNGHDLETGSIFSKDDSLMPDEEKFHRRFRRRVKVRSLTAAARVLPLYVGCILCHQDVIVNLQVLPPVECSCQQPQCLMGVLPVPDQLGGDPDLPVLPAGPGLLPVGAHHQNPGPGALPLVRHPHPGGGGHGQHHHHPVRRQPAP